MFHEGAFDGATLEEPRRDTGPEDGLHFYCKDIGTVF